MKKAKGSYLAAALSMILLCAVVLGGLSLYNTKLRGDLTKSTFESLHEMQTQQKVNLSARLDADILAAENMAKMVRYLPQKGDTVQLLNELRRDTNFNHILIADLAGQGLVSTGAVVDVKSAQYFTAALQGETGLYLPTPSLIGDSIVLPFSTPIWEQGKVSGVLCAVYDVGEIGKLLFPAYGGKSVTYITDSDGNILVKPDESAGPFGEKSTNNNLLQRLDGAKFHGNDDRTAISTSMDSGEAGESVLSLADHRLVLSYEPLGIRDWYIFMVVPEAVITTQAGNMTDKALLMTWGILLLFAVFVLYTLRAQKKADAARSTHTAQLERLAYYDNLSDLPNLQQFKRLSAALLEARAKEQVVVTKLDIVNFKVINDVFGFATGDWLLRQIGQLMSQMTATCGMPHRITARVNADEFVFIDVFDGDLARQTKLTRAFKKRLDECVSEVLGAHRVELRYGRYFTYANAECIDDMLEKANLAHRTAKWKKTAQSCDYDESIKQTALREIDLSNRMGLALESGEFLVYLQPKFALHDEGVVGAEALVRWRDTQTGDLIMPCDFIPLFERNGMIIRLDLYMFEQVCRLLRTWMDEGREPVPLSVNLSRLHLDNEKLPQELCGIAARYAVPHKYIEIELTESVIYENGDRLEQLLQELHELDFRISMDDFGAGYSSLGLLKNLHVDIIKIDRSFFISEKHHDRARTVLESVMQMAKRLDILTVAEGVETEEYVDFLCGLGCDMVQGYYYAKPMPCEDFYENYGNRITQLTHEDYRETFEVQALHVERDTLGAGISSAFYLLLRRYMESLLCARYGEDEMRRILFTSGLTAGRSFVKEHMTEKQTSLAALAEHLRICLAQHGTVAELHFLQEYLQITLHHKVLKTYDEGTVQCHYETGFLQAVFSQGSGRDFEVKEIVDLALDAQSCTFAVKELVKA